MRLSELTLVLAMVTGLVLGCGGATPLLRPARTWPEAPQQARVRYERAVYGSADLGETFWQKVQGFVFGRDDRQGLSKPYGVCVSGGRWLVADTGRDRVLVFDWERREVSVLDRLDSRRSLVEPVNVAVGPDQKIYVADAGLHRVVRFSATGEFEDLIGSDESLVSPVGLAWDGEGRLLVTDSRAHRVVVFGEDGGVFATFGGRGDGPGQFYYPLGIAVAGDGTILVVDALHFTVQRFSTQFEYLDDFGHDQLAAARLPRPRSVGVDAWGNVYVTDALRHAVVVFDAAGREQFVFGGHGAGEGEFRLPAGIAVTGDGRILVIDSLNQRVVEFSLIRG